MHSDVTFYMKVLGSWGFVALLQLSLPKTVPIGCFAMLELEVRNRFKDTDCN